MTRIPGDNLRDTHESCSPEEIESILREVGDCLAKIRTFPSPYGEMVCGPLGGTIFNREVPNYNMDPETNSHTFHTEVLKWEQSRLAADGEQLLTRAKRLNDRRYKICFGHSDLAPHNIMIKDGRLTGIIDWEYCGWYGFIIIALVDNVG